MIQILTLISIGICSRIFPHMPNMTAVASIALFAAATTSRTKALIIVFSTMLITDAFFGFHAVMWATYLSFGLSVLLGSVIRRVHFVWPMVLSMSLLGSLQFFIITNFAVWAMPGSMYPHTFEGLLSCYTMALPFFRNSLIGDMSYTFIFFGAYQYIHSLGHRFFLVSKHGK